MIRRDDHFCAPLLAGELSAKLTEGAAAPAPLAAPSVRCFAPDTSPVNGGGHLSIQEA